jgi:hypothetical protein
MEAPKPQAEKTRRFTMKAEEFITSFIAWWQNADGIEDHQRWTSLTLFLQQKHGDKDVNKGLKLEVRSVKARYKRIQKMLDAKNTGVRLPKMPTGTKPKKVEWSSLATMLLDSGVGVKVKE